MAEGGRDLILDGIAEGLASSPTTTTRPVARR